MSDNRLAPYINMVEFLGKVLGPDYEIVLQDPNKKEHAIVAIANGHISGRRIGGPLTDLSLKLIADKEYEYIDYRANYNGLSKDNKIMRSSTFFIKNNGELIGMLCINFDSSRYLDLSKEILYLCHPNQLVDENYNFTPTNHLLDVSENFTGSIPELIAAILENSFLNEHISLNRLNRDEKLHIVDILNKKGVFLMKGAVAQVAEQLHCSEASIYRYLNALSNDNEK